ncbi:MAG: hypothetical protein WAX07_05525 [Candidatus Altiarchaeia archaeon]|jgi:hypothetical protein
MAAKIKKKGKKTIPKPAIKKVKKGKKERDDTDEISDLERDVDRGEDVEKGAIKSAVKEELEKVDVIEEEDDGGEVYEYGERGILSDEDESDEEY